MTSALGARRLRRLALVVAVAVLPAGLARGADAPPSGAPSVDPWERLRVLEGSWRGTGEGKGGYSTVTRDYCWVLNGRFLEAKSRSVYPPQKKNLKGESHEDWGFISFDRARNSFVMRQFHVEGFVNQYRLVRQDDSTLVFESEAIENIPAGFRARETYRFRNTNEFTETFELAPPGKEYEVYTVNKLIREPTAAQSMPSKAAPTQEGP